MTSYVEHQELEWQGHPLMELGADGRWAFPEPFRQRVPVMFTMTAIREE